MSEPASADRPGTAGADAPSKGPPLDLGVFGRKPEGGASATDIIAAALTVIWLAAVGLFFMVAGWNSGTGTGPSPLTVVLILLAVFMPIALIWVAATTARVVGGMRAETRRLQTAVDAMRHAYVAQQQTATTGGLRPTVERKLDEIAAATRKTETAIATFASRRDSARVVASADRSNALPLGGPDGGDQPGLALGTPSEALRPPITTETFIRALHFPETAEDRDGFRALRLALEDPTVVRLVRASQDILTLLSQEGIYMDDLTPDRSRPEIWRRFAAGERGRAIAALGGVRDRSSLALTAARMKQDPIFRDAAHHFLRTFDKTFAAFEANATDQDIADFAETRTARAFMLIGRVTGTFD